MAIQTFEQVYKDIRAKVFKPVYFLMGEEPFFIDVLSDTIEKHALTEDEKEFNLSILYGKDTDISNVLNAAKRFPMMADYHLVIVREAQSLKQINPKEKAKDESVEPKANVLPAKGAKKSKPKAPDDFDLLIKYLENPLKTTILVICHKYKTITPKSRLSQAVDKCGVIVESKRINESKLPSWIDDYVKKKGYQIHPKAAQLVADHLGNDLSKVINELQKLFIVLPKDKEITPVVIEENIGISKDFNIFELQTAIGSKNREKAFRIAKYFGDNPKANPLFMTLPVLYLFFKKIMLYHCTPDKSPTSLANALGVNPFFVKDYQTAAKNYPQEDLEKIFAYLRNCDLQSKGVGQKDTNQGELLKELLFKVMR